MAQNQRFESMVRNMDRARALSGDVAGVARRFLKIENSYVASLLGVRLGDIKEVRVKSSTESVGWRALSPTRASLGLFAGLLTLILVYRHFFL
jgi:hypothetical protein